MTNGGIYGAFSTDNNLEVNGKWFDFSANNDKTIPGFLLARMAESNPAYQAAAEALHKELGVDIELDILSNERAKPYMIALFTNTILKGWRNLQDRHGVIIEYNAANATKVLNDLPDLYRVLAAEAKKMSNYRDAAIVHVSE